MNTRALLAVAFAALITTPAVAGLKLAPGNPDVLNALYDPSPAIIPLGPGDPVVKNSAVLADGPVAAVEFEYAGFEAANVNLVTSDGTILFSTLTSTPGDTAIVSVSLADGDLVPFQLERAPGGGPVDAVIANGETLTAQGLDLRFADLNDGRFAVLFGDGFGDNDFDDVKFTVAASTPVPEPSSLAMLGAALAIGGLGIRHCRPVAKTFA